MQPLSCLLSIQLFASSLWQLQIVNKDGGPNSADGRVLYVISNISTLAYITRYRTCYLKRLFENNFFLRRLHPKDISCQTPVEREIRHQGSYLSYRTGPYSLPLSLSSSLSFSLFLFHSLSLPLSLSLSLSLTLSLSLSSSSALSPFLRLSLSPLSHRPFHSPPLSPTPSSSVSLPLSLPLSVSL